MEIKSNIYAKLNTVRAELSKDLQKSGKNSYSKYDYFQLKDFMPQAIKLCEQYGLFTKFWIDKEKLELPAKITNTQTFNEAGQAVITEVKEENFTYVEYAHLLVIDTESEDIIEFKKETRECQVQAAQPIQNLGSKSTYMKRYMYIDVFEINENDEIEENTGTPEPKVEKKTTRSSSKPKVSEVSTQPVVYTEAKSVEEMAAVNNNIVGTWVPQAEPVAQPTPAPTTVSPVVEASVEVQTEGLMSMETKIALANAIKEAGLDPKVEILNIARELGTDVPLLKESDKDKVLEILNKKVGK